MANASTVAAGTTDSGGNVSSSQGTGKLNEALEAPHVMAWDDATWILTSSFIIFTMQSGFGMLESGCVGHKNEVNIMMKNVGDVIFGGISYWMLGYGFSFGTDPGTNAFCGFGKFFLDPDDTESLGSECAHFVFQMSFATTATTIVSGAVAERTKFLPYLVFSFFNTFIYCFPAHWVWAQNGWLRNLGVVDVAGDGPVHLVGGVSALVAAIIIKPRQGRFTKHDHHEMESPVGAILGMFILWWSWLAFSCGSTYGISGGKWKIAARSAANTLMAANSGGIVAFLSSYIIHRKFYVRYVINGILASLVSITASCGVTTVKESLAIGGVGALLTLLANRLMEVVKVDDPVSAFAVHGVGGMWGLLATGVFAHKDEVASLFNDRQGLAAGGGFYLLGVQTLEVVSITVWTALTSILLLKAIDIVLGLRVTQHEEEVGIDQIEHDVHFIPYLTQHHSPSTSSPPSSSPSSSSSSHGPHLNPAFLPDKETLSSDSCFAFTTSSSSSVMMRRSVYSISSFRDTRPHRTRRFSANDAESGKWPTSDVLRWRDMVFPQEGQRECVGRKREGGRESRRGPSWRGKWGSAGGKGQGGGEEKT